MLIIEALSRFNTAISFSAKGLHFNGFAVGFKLDNRVILYDMIAPKHMVEGCFYFTWQHIGKETEASHVDT